MTTLSGKNVIIHVAFIREKNYGSNQSYSFMQMTHNIILVVEVFI